jgi:hypothetical protein
MFEVDEAGLKSGRRRGYIAGEARMILQKVCLSPSTSQIVRACWWRLGGFETLSMHGLIVCDTISRSKFFLPRGPSSLM